MVLHNGPGLFMAASQSQRRKARCSALVPHACRDTAGGDLVFLCCDKQCMPVLWAAEDAPGRRGGSQEESPWRTRGTDTSVLARAGCKSGVLPATSQPCHPLAFWPGCHMATSSYTHPSTLLQPHHLHTLIFSPRAGLSPGLLKPLLRFLVFTKLAVKSHPGKWPCKSPWHGATNSLPLISSSTRKKDVSLVASPPKETSELRHA